MNPRNFVGSTPPKSTEPGISIVAGAKNRPTSRAWMSPKANALSVTVGMDSVCAVTSEPTVRSVGPMLGTDE